MPSIDAGISMLSKSMEDQKLIVQMLTDAVVALNQNAAAKETLRKVEDVAEESSAPWAP
jgi:hypothetical protein